MTEPPNGEPPPDDTFAQPPSTPPEPPPNPYGQPPPWGTPPGHEPPPWGAPQGYGPPPGYGAPGYGQQPVWGQQAGWPAQAPDRPTHVRVAEFFLGMVACVALNLGFLFLVPRIDVFGQATALFIVAVNLIAIVLPGVKGHRSFSAGFAAGYGAIVMIGFVACFVAFSQL